jgi:hypothetical protein
MLTFNDIKRTLDALMRDQNSRPKTVAISYDDGVNLLNQWVMMRSSSDTQEISEMLIRGDRGEITTKLNNMTAYGVKLIIADLVIKGEE